MSRNRFGKSRRGASLIEVMVVIAILVALAAIVIPGISGLLSMEQSAVAKNLAITYAVLHDEAVLRNVTFRVAYHLDEGFYEVEVGSADSLIFADPEAREQYEEDLERKNRHMTDEEKSLDALQDETSFDKLQDTFETRVTLPRGTKFGGVFTPQYGKLVSASGDPEVPMVAYSYVFPNGYAERAIVQIVDDDDPESGYTVEVEPLSGQVHLHTEVLRPEELEADVPDEAPKMD